MKKIDETKFTINCTGDCCVGDYVVFEKAFFVGVYPKSKFSHCELIYAHIVSDSYGQKKQQHTFTCVDLESGSKFTIKGRNLYRNGTKRMFWVDEHDRIIALHEKHNRGNIARLERKIRINNKYY